MPKCMLHKKLQFALSTPGIGLIIIIGSDLFMASVEVKPPGLIINISAESISSFIS